MVDEEGGLAAYREMLKKTPDEVTVSNNLYWLANYEFDHDQRKEAFRLASRAAATGSGSGLRLMGWLLERSGQLEQSFEYVRQVQERYQNRVPMLAFYLRHRDHFKGSTIEQHVAPVLAEVFANGLESVVLPTLRGAPRDGVLVKIANQRMNEVGLRQGAILVALDGFRIRTLEQYDCILALTETPTLRLIAWQDGAYVEVTPTLKNRWFGAGTRFETYQP